ncbi:ATP synthase regulation protein NCA2-domain-containing protein [Tribonema minus]|uniref:ATP synthase regulation protein NCA2-domain-containing protein n=1 Tax=Tribonema minus TaxID=303371 RepID=A0A835YHP7_9STRA|nr:ATP synthase regulation protein NCA2-domain-containing protein [Tribonema minus]
MLWHQQCLCSALRHDTQLAPALDTNLTSGVAPRRAAVLRRARPALVVGALWRRRRRRRLGRRLGWRARAAAQAHADTLQLRIRATILSVGRMQAHITRMRHSYATGALDAWVHQALAIVMAHLGRLHRLRDGGGGCGDGGIGDDAASAVAACGGGDASALAAAASSLQRSARAVLSAAEARPAQTSALLGACAPAPFARRHWYLLAVGLPAAALLIMAAERRRAEIGAALRGARASLRTFVSEHISQPGRAIYDELFRNARATIDDAAALDDSSQSLRRMLEAFIRERHPGMAARDVDALVANMDMSTVSREYEKSIVTAMRSIVSGDIVRMLLIQVQFMKTKLLVLLNSMEDLMHENEFNMRVMATVPAVALAAGAYHAVRPLYYAVRRVKSRSATIIALRFTILGMERLLNLRNSGMRYYRARGGAGEFRVKSRSATIIALRFSILGMERLLNLRNSGMRYYRARGGAGDISHSATIIALRFTILGMERLLNLRNSGMRYYRARGGGGATIIALRFTMLGMERLLNLRNSGMRFYRAGGGGGGGGATIIALRCTILGMERLLNLRNSGMRCYGKLGLCYYGARKGGDATYPPVPCQEGVAPAPCGDAKYPPVFCRSPRSPHGSAALLTAIGSAPPPPPPPDGVAEGIATGAALGRPPLPPPPQQQQPRVEVTPGAVAAALEAEAARAAAADDDGSGGGGGAHAHPDGDLKTLDELDLGKLVLLAYQVRRLVGRHERRFRRDELHNLNEDLCELMGDRGIVTVGQQLSILGGRGGGTRRRAAAVAATATARGGGGDSRSGSAASGCGRWFDGCGSSSSGSGRGERQRQQQQRQHPLDLVK